MTNYTPGPWLSFRRDCKGPEQRIVRSIDIYESFSCVVKGCNAQEDSQLIAAAPDLLEACKWALAAEKTLPKGIRHPALEKALENSIAKAKGKS